MCNDKVMVDCMEVYHDHYDAESGNPAKGMVLTSSTVLPVTKVVRYESVLYKGKCVIRILVAYSDKEAADNHSELSRDLGYVCSIHNGHYITIT